MRAEGERWKESRTEALHAGVMRTEVIEGRESVKRGQDSRSRSTEESSIEMLKGISCFIHLK